MMLNISKDIAIPIDAVTQTFAILAKRRVGKTYTASVMAEEYVKANLPFAVLDPTGAWWGLRSGKDGKPEGGLPVYVIGGEHGIPLEPTAGKVIADQVATHPAFYVIDVSQFESNAAQDRFTTDFGEHLYRIKEKHRAPMHLFIDEADSFMPQRPMPGQQRMLGAFEALVRRGGIRGIGVTLISQRAAVVNKNVLTQTECLIVLQTTSPQDQDAIEEWVKRNGTDENRKVFMSSLASLQKGEAWIWSPAWLEVFQRIHIRERETFNSSATPKAGEKKIIQPKLRPVDIEKLSQQIKATIEKAKENDPDSLRKKIRELERQHPKQVDEQAIVRAAEKARQETSREFVQKIRSLDSIIKKLQNDIQRASTILDNSKPHTSLGMDTLPHIQQATIPKGEYKYTPMVPRGIRVPTGNNPLPPVIRKPGNEPINIEDCEPKLRAGARRLLAALVQWSPNGITEGQMRSHAGLRNSGTYSAYKTDLRRFGFMEERSGMIFATQGGIGFLGHDMPSPNSTEEVLQVWMPKLRLGARRMLQVLIDHAGETMTDQQLQEESELANSGTYSAYKTELKTAQLIIIDRGTVTANKETLFL